MNLTHCPAVNPDLHCVSSICLTFKVYSDTPASLVCWFLHYKQEIFRGFKKPWGLNLTLARKNKIDFMVEETF